jgi:rhodanese-related sulfurtransferase
MVFFCANARCWLSYNAALRAARLGYTGVRWYRGGVEAWGVAGGALVEPSLVWRQP